MAGPAGNLESVSRVAISMAERLCEAGSTVEDIDGMIRDADHAQRAIALHIGHLQDEKRAAKERRSRNEPRVS